MVFYVCRDAFYTVLCNTIKQKTRSVGKVGALLFLLFFHFPLQRVMLLFLDEVKLCQKNLILIYIYFLHALLPVANTAL